MHIHTFTIMILFIKLLLILDVVESFRKGNCSEVKSPGKIRWFCCNNHEEVNGNCIECLTGFESLDGRPCSFCPEGSYGKECLETCNCKKTECNHIKGCINIQHNTTGENKESTIPLTTTRQYNVSWFTTLLSPTIELNTFRGNPSTVMISSRRLTSATIKPKLNDLGLNSRAIIVYSICAGTFAFCLLMCRVFHQRYKHIYENVKRYLICNRRGMNTTENPQPDIPMEEIDGIYEVIDESNMIDNFDDLRIDNVSVTNTNGGYVLQW